MNRVVFRRDDGAKVAIDSNRLVSWVVLFVIGLAATSFTTAVHAEPSTIEKLSLLQKGSPPVAELQPIMDRVLRKYGESVTEEGYRRLGNVLLALQKEADTPGFETLTCLDDQRLMEEMGNAAVMCSVAIRSLR